jgi:hypothetical protein
LGRYIFTNIHKILFGGFHKELYEWLARLENTEFEIIFRPPLVWTSTLIKKVKRVDNIVSRVVYHWFDTSIGGYITMFSIDRIELYR